MKREKKRGRWRDRQSQEGEKREINFLRLLGMHPNSFISTNMYLQLQIPTYIVTIVSLVP